MSKLVNITDEFPFPPRYWWFKRIVIAYAILFLALLALRLWWGHVAHSRLEAEIARYEAAGEPIEPEDFDPKDVIRDGENAVRLLEQAEAALPTRTARTEWMIESGCRDRATWEQHRAEIARVIAANAPVIEKTHEARSRGKVDWGLRMRSPMWTALLTNLSAERQVGKVVGAAARNDHYSGNDAAAVEKLRDILAQANAIEQQPTLIAHLVAMAVGHQAVSTVEDVARSLRLSPEGSGAPTDGTPASEAQVRALIGELVDLQTAYDAQVRAMLVERAMQRDLVRSIVRCDWATIFGGLPTPAATLASAFSFPIRPLHVLAGVEAMRRMDRWVAAARSPTWKQARLLVARDGELDDRSSDRPLSWFLFPFASLTPSLERAATLHYRRVAHRRMAATALAIRLFVVDHGHRPARLEELVPEYLPDFPLDPFGDESEPIHYAPEHDPPMLYSLGADGVDDGGTYELRGTGFVNWDKLDFPFFLDGNPHPGPLPELPDAPPEDTSAVSEDE